MEHFHSQSKLDKVNPFVNLILSTEKTKRLKFRFYLDNHFPVGIVEDIY